VQKISAAAEKWPFSLPRQQCTPPSQAEGQGSQGGVRSPGILGGTCPSERLKGRIEGMERGRVFYGKHIDFVGKSMPVANVAVASVG